MEISLKCSYLSEKNPLVDTKNRLLDNQTQFTGQRDLLQTALKRKCNLSSTVCLRSELFPISKKLTKPSLENKFLILEKPNVPEPVCDTALSAEVDDELFLQKKKKKGACLFDGFEIDVEPITENAQILPEYPLISNSYTGENQLHESPPMFGCASFGMPSMGQPPMFGSGFGMPPMGKPPMAMFQRCGFSRNFESASDELNLFQLPLKEMPVYYFEPVRPVVSNKLEFKSVENDSDFQLTQTMREIKAIKVCFLNVVTTSLLYSPRFINPDDPFRLLLLKHLKEVVSVDPEFVLKVALYARQELNIRSTTNFLLAYSASDKNCRIYLKKYFSSSVCLPTDWIDVAEQFSVLDHSLKPRSLPSALRKVMKSTFKHFDKYQLAKYDKKVPKKSKQKIKEGKSKEISMEDKEKKKISYSLKYLIKLLHINSPIEEVMCIVGKKYPEGPEDFRQSGLPGVWDSKKSGKRMKLPVPETWETMVASRGNKADVWESLIDNKKLPYMAMLRNLRNMIMAGISRGHHSKVQSLLTRKESIVRSRQFPLRFYAAFKVIENLQNCANGETKNKKLKSATPIWKQQQMKNIQKKIHEVDPGILDSYQNSINQAIEIAACNNMNPIAGKTLIICDLVDTSTKATGEVASYFSKRFHSCVMLSLMCLKACEDCEVKAILSNNSYETMKLQSKSFLKNMSDVCSKYECTELSSEESVGESDNSRIVEHLAVCDILSEQLQELQKYYLRSDVIVGEKLDNIILIISSEHFDENVGREAIEKFLRKYRELVNPDLLYVQVDLTAGSERGLSSTPDLRENDIYVKGFSEHIFKFIAERGNGGQVAYVENIDKKYELQEIKDCMKFDTCTIVPATKQNHPFCSSPRLKTVRIFISSTFKDMHGERDVLLRYVFPELKARASTLFINVNEIDLRWGITEADSSSKRCAELCLKEVQNCDFFIGILGERYGTRYAFDVPDDPDLDWVKSYPKNSSITELEMYCGALKEPIKKRDHAFFYIRDDSFIRQVPKEWVDCFEAEDSESKAKLVALKYRIKSSGFELFEGYPCHWAGVLNEKPIVAGLDQFGKRVLDNLWNALLKFNKKELFEDEITEELAFHQSQTELHGSFYGEEGTPLSWLLGEMTIKSGIFLVTGKSGCGKTTFIVNLLKKLKDDPVIPFFIGASPRSTDLSYMLYCIAFSILTTMAVRSVLPKTKEGLNNNFSDIMAEGAKCSRSGRLIIVIDGLDYLDSEAQVLDWLPFDLPAGIQLICSASESSASYKNLKNREKYGASVFFAPLKPLAVPDRQQLVRHYLEQHRKTLDENPFNNQMIQLVTKSDSGNPLYLHLACDYLRTFALFENLMNNLRSFPSALNQVLEKVIVQMEKSHGYGIVQTALNLMCIAKEGLEESQLHILLSISEYDNTEKMPSTFNDIYVKAIKVKPESMMSPINFYSLVHMLKTFACPYGTLSHGILRLSTIKFFEVVKKYYYDNNYTKKFRYWHMLLAAYYMMRCDPANNGTWTGQSGSAFRNLPYHLLHGRCYKELVKTLCSLSFIQSSFKQNAADEILEYFVVLLQSNEIKSSSDLNGDDFERLEDYHAFISKKMHILKVYPLLVHQLGINENQDSLIHKESLVGNTPLMKCLTRSSHSSCLTRTLDGFLKDILCIKCHPVEPIAVLGSDDGDVKILKVDTGKILTSLKGHSSKITAACFLGCDRICTASADTTLSIWSHSDNCRICVLKGHTQYISSCCADLQDNVVSAGWDRSVRFWSSQDGRQISCIDNLSCPVNTLSHHPDQQQIACGLWNGNVEVWNAMSLKREHVLRGNSGSVRSVTYSANGLNIISSTINGNVIIWSSIECLKISKLEGHTLAVNCIGCCSKGSVIVTGSDDTTLKVWPDKEQLPSLIIHEFKDVKIHFMEILSGIHLAVAFLNNTICIFDLIDGHLVSKLDSSEDPVLCFSKHSGIVDSKFAPSLSAFLFGTRSGKVMKSMYGSSTASLVTSMGASVIIIRHTEHFILYGTVDGDIALYTVDEDLLFTERKAHANSITALSICTNGVSPLILTTSSDKMIKLWENVSGSLVLCDSYLSKHRDHISSCFLFRKPSSKEKDDVTIITGSYDNSAIARNKEKLLELCGLDTSVSNVFYTGKFILGCGRNGSIAVWTKLGKLVSCTSGIEQSSAIFAIDFQKDKLNDFDSTLAYVAMDGSIVVKKPFQRLPLCTLLGHSQKVTSCDINSKNVILSCSSDKSVNIWKFLPSMKSCNIYHRGKISDVSLSFSKDLVLSGDVYGNLVLWKINKEGQLWSMVYATQHKYSEGVIRAILWINEKEFACAVAFLLNSKETYTVDIFSCEDSLDSIESKGTMRVIRQHLFPSEVMSLDYDEVTDVLAVGLKSGCIFLIDSHKRMEIPLEDDWILKVKLQGTNCQTLCYADSQGCIGFLPYSSKNETSTADLLRARIMRSVECVKPSSLAWITALNCDNKGIFYAGDSSGNMTIFQANDSSRKQIHSSAVTSICVSGTHIFTSSLDKTVKVWNLATINQVGLFHCTVPISSMSLAKTVWKAGLTEPPYLVIGTAVGDVQMLTWLPPQNKFFFFTQ